MNENLVGVLSLTYVYVHRIGHPALSSKMRASTYFIFILLNMYTYLCNTEDLFLEIKVLVGLYRV